MTALATASVPLLVGPISALALQLDPTIVMRRSGLIPDPWQAELIRDENNWWLLLCTRQGGKTQAISALALATALNKRGALVLILTPSERQSKEVLRCVSQYYLALFGVPFRTDAITALKIELPNNSRIIALPGSSEKTIRVYAGVDLLLVDEAARVPDELFYSVMPMLAVSGGRMICASTPWFSRGFLYREFKDGGDHWKRVMVTADDCPRIDRKFLARERRTKPAAWFAQEYYCQWGSTAAALFPADMVDSLLSRDVAAYLPQRARFL